VGDAQSETLLNVEKISKPFDYCLHIYRDGETRVQKVDLPETFNYLIGLDVARRQVLDDNGRYYLVIAARRARANAPWSSGAKPGDLSAVLDAIREESKRLWRWIRVACFSTLNLNTLDRVIVGHEKSLIGELAFCGAETIRRAPPNEPTIAPSPICTVNHLPSVVVNVATTVQA